MADTSPTGTPVLPPKYVPVLLVVLAGVNAALLALTQGDFPPSVKLVAQVLLATLGPVLAALSPGLRKPDGGGGAPLAKALGAAGSVTTSTAPGGLSRSWAQRMLEQSRLLLVVAAVGLVTFPAGVRAQVLASTGPTLPLMEVRPSNPHPVSLAAGAGYQLSLTLPQLQKDIGGKTWDLVDVQLMLFGSAVSNSSGGTFGALSVAGGFSFLSSLFFAGGGHDALTAPGLKPGWFGLFALSLNLNFSSAPPPSFDRASWRPLRGNTLYLGGL